ncbi:MAG: alpha/beta hydrolase [Rhodobacteraceae bacterium]|nr:alpha/beta hydrolase [Paracoccaceae bacterium]
MTNPMIAARDAFSVEYPEKRVVLNGRDWGVLDVGQGPALVLISGTLGRGDVFWNQITALKNRLRIVAVSYPSEGGIEDWTEDMVQLLDQLDIESATILGSSLGGYLAQFIAGTHPKRISRLIAANTLHSAKGLDQMPPYALDLETAPIDTLRAGFGMGLEGWAKAHPDQANLVELLLQESGGRILESELRARLSALKFGQELPEPAIDAANIVTIEVDDDPLISPQMREAVRARLSPSVAYRFTDGGHFPYLARPADYTSLLEQVMGLNITGPDWGTENERVL